MKIARQIGQRGSLDVHIFLFEVLDVLVFRDSLAFVNSSSNCHPQC